MICPHANSCPLFPKLVASLSFWRQEYCDNEKHKSCARFQKSTAGEAVPITLLPNGKDLAKGPYQDPKQ